MDKNITLTKTFQWFFLLFIMLVAFFASAQITITHEDLPNIGTTLIRELDSASIADAGGSGMNQTWDFSNAEGYLSDTVVYVDPTTIPGNELFPGSNLAEGRTIYDSTGDFFNYIFWNLQEDGLYGTGWLLFFGSPEFNYTSTQQYHPIPNTLALPLTYGSEHTAATVGLRYTSTRVAGMLIDSSRVISHISVIQEVDGSGTLITPAGSYQALRMMEVSTHIDSTYSWDMFGGWTFDGTETYQLTNYRWFANNIGEVATLSVDEELNEFQYVSSIVINVPEVVLEGNLKLFPNPTGDVLMISSDKPVSKCEIYSINGQLLKTVVGERVIDVSAFEPGTYLFKAYSGQVVMTAKFVKK